MKVCLRYADLIRIEDLLLDSLWKMRRAAERGHRIEPLIEETEDTLRRMQAALENDESDAGGFDELTAGGLSEDP